MNKIVYGDRVFEQKAIKSGNCYIATSLLSDQLEANSFEVDVKSDDKTLMEYNQNDPLTFSYNGRQVGVFYVQNIKRVGPDVYHISATSTIGLLEQRTHYGNIYTGQTVEETVADICGDVQVVIKSNIKKIKLYGWLPIATARDNLAQVVFAIGATVKTDTNGVLHIEGLWSGTAAHIGKDHVFSGGSVTNATKTTRVVVTEHQYVEGGEETKLFEGTSEHGDIIKFDDPCYNLTATGFTILQSNANYAIVSAGSGVLMGNKYIHVTRDVIKRPAGRSSNGYENESTVKDATLVSLANSNAVSERLVNYYGSTQTISQDIEVTDEATGDVVDVYDPYDRAIVQACLQSMDITLSRIMRATEKFLVDYLPTDIGEQEYYDRVDIITESGTWTAPDGVTSARAVLIGGGQGGQCGYKGESGSSVPASFSYGLAVAQATGYAVGLGGDGGAGGNAGHGGKVLQASISVRPHQSFTVVIGAGGKGAAYSDDMPMGTEGEDTLFGELSTVTGAYSDNGYIDTLTGAVYAEKGLSGIAGGKGGSGTNKSPQDASTVIEFVQGEDVIDEDGNRWHAGATPTTTYGDSKNSIYWRAKTATAKNNTGGLDNGYGTAGSSAACGGGAAAGTNGTDSEQGTGSHSASASGSVVYVRATGRSGIDGAVPSLIPKTPTMYGRGGRGGYGGGGAGGSGMSFVAKRIGSAVSNVSGSASPGADGSGGAGGAGGNGADGCVIIYYSMPKPNAAGGPIRDKNGKIIIDKFKRKLVV